MENNFKSCLALVLKSEGGWTGAKGLEATQAAKPI